jgi:SAM-dependent methyltransferase
MIFELIGPAGCGKTSVARLVYRALDESGLDHVGFSELQRADRSFGEKRITRQNFFGKTWTLLPLIVRHPTVVAATLLLAGLHGGPYKRRFRQANRALAHIQMVKRITRNGGERILVLHEGLLQMLWSTTVESEALRGRPLVRYLLRRYQRILHPRGILFRIDDRRAQERVFQRAEGNRFSAKSNERRRAEFPKWLAYHRQLVDLAPAGLIHATVDASQPLEALARDVTDAVLRCLPPGSRRLGPVHAAQPPRSRLLAVPRPEQAFRTAWTEGEVEDLLAREDFSYQRIQLPYGFATGGDDRSATAAAILPEDMTGKSVLDVGSKYGFFCFEALKRGAVRAVGVDLDPESLRKSRLLADCLGADASFERLDIESDPIDETFDYVLCLNVLHHLKNPIAALDKLIAVTRERLILEVASLGRHDRRKLGLSAVGRFLLNREPIVYVSRGSALGKRSTQNFFLTAPAIENLLTTQRGSFARVETRTTTHKDRFITIAEKRHIRRLLVVAGPTACGKSTLIEQLQKHEAPELAKRLGIEDGSRWAVLAADHLHLPGEARMESAFFHYDLLRPCLTGGKLHSRDAALEILDVAEEVAFLTIWCPPAVLLPRLARRALAPSSAPLEDCRDPARLRFHYRRWFDYTSARPGEHVVVAPAEGLELRTVEEWDEKTRHLEG